MNKKYFTPVIEDLCIGLEFEKKSIHYFNYKEEHAESYYSHLPLIEIETKSERFEHNARYKTEEWLPLVASPTELSKFIFSLDAGDGLHDYRIKVLDEEDIESLGWNRLKMKSADNPNTSFWGIFFNNPRTGHNMEAAMLMYIPDTNWILISDNKQNTLLSGTIKHKARLKWAMEATCII